MRKRNIKQAVFGGLFVCYMIALLGITVIRPWDGGIRLMGGRLHLTFFADYISIFHNSIPIFIYLFVGNIVWFIPFGLYLAGVRKVPVRRVVLYGFCLSLFIEVMQYVLGTGISETDDLFLNTFGALIGAVIGVICRKIFCRTAPPGRGR